MSRETRRPGTLQKTLRQQSWASRQRKSTGWHRYGTSGKGSRPSKSARWRLGSRRPRVRTKNIVVEEENGRRRPQNVEHIIRNQRRGKTRRRFAQVRRPGISAWWDGTIHRGCFQISQAKKIQVHEMRCQAVWCPAESLCGPRFHQHHRVDLFGRGWKAVSCCSA